MDWEGTLQLGQNTGEIGDLCGLETLALGVSRSQMGRFCGCAIEEKRAPRKGTFGHNHGKATKGVTKHNKMVNGEVKMKVKNKTKNLSKISDVVPCSLEIRFYEGSLKFLMMIFMPFA